MKTLDLILNRIDDILFEPKNSDNYEVLKLLCKQFKGESEMEIDKREELNRLLLEYGEICSKMGSSGFPENIAYVASVATILAQYNAILASNTKPAPKWTSDLPTQEGWYWWRGVLPDRAGTFMVYVFGPSNHKDMIFYFPMIEAKLYGVDAGRDSEWYGPIEPPEYTEKEN